LSDTTSARQAEDEVVARQAKDKEEGKKLLAQDYQALPRAAGEGDKTKVGRVLAPRLTIPATPDFTLRSN
jgi:hypothetical protein